MSVVGSLEDLSFPDILQVVHLSRQSGTLILSGPGGEKRVRFRNGLVSDASLGADGPRLEEILVARGVVSPAAIEPAKTRAGTTGESLTAALVALGGLSQETLDAVVRDEVRALVRSFVLLQEGEFRFEPDDDASPPDAGPGGLEPDVILGGLPEIGSPRWPTEAPPPSSVPRKVLLVSERSYLTLALREELERSGFEAVATDSAADGLLRARGLAERGERFLLVCDLVLPDPTRTGWSGGLDLVREARALAPDLVTLVVGEIRHPSAAVAARAAGAAGYLPLPDLSAVPFDEVGVRVHDFCAHVGSALTLSDAGAGVDWSAGASIVRVADPLSLLRGLVGELHADAGGDVGLLVLRLASEYFERAALFAVRERAAHCRGAFGPPVDDRMRGAMLPIADGSSLARVVERRETCVAGLSDDGPDRLLKERLGPPEPRTAAFLPVLGGREVFGVLYGDNALSGAPFEDLKALEIFLSQAGLALQNALLRRRIETLTGEDSGRACPPGEAA